MTRPLATLLALIVAVPAVASPAEALAAAVADSRKLSSGERVHTRYLDLSAIPVEYRSEAIKVLWYQINAISRNPEIVRPVSVGRDLLRVSILEYGWPRNVWEALSNTDPYHHVRIVQRWPGGTDSSGVYWAAGDYKVSAAAPWLDTGQIAELITLTQSKAPIVRADWWFLQTARNLGLNNRDNGIGYYNWLGIKDKRSFDKLVGFDEKASLAILKEMRAAVERSGVAQFGRQVRRLQSLNGSYYETLDVDSPEGRKNVIRNLGRGELEHVATEVYGTLGNGLFAFMLADAQGKLQSSAPDFIGADDSALRSGRDGRIHVGLSCVRCHVEGLRPITDWVRTTLRPPLGLQSPDYAKTVELRRQYFSNLDRQLERDRQVYADALRDVNGWTPAENAKAFARLWDWYAIRGRGLDDLAQEVGIAPEKLAQALKAGTLIGKTPLELSGLLRVPPEPVRVEFVEENYAVIQELVRAVR